MKKDFGLIRREKPRIDKIKAPPISHFI